MERMFADGKELQRTLNGVLGFCFCAEVVGSGNT